MTEKERFEARMNAKHPLGWEIGGITLAPGANLTEEELYAELNRIEDLDEQGLVTRHTNFPDVAPQRSWLLD